MVDLCKSWKRKTKNYSATHQSSYPVIHRPVWVCPTVCLSDGVYCKVTCNIFCVSRKHLEPSKWKFLYVSPVVAPVPAAVLCHLSTIGRWMRLWIARNLKKKINKCGNKLEVNLIEIRAKEAFVLLRMKGLFPPLWNRK